MAWSSFAREHTEYLFLPLPLLFFVVLGMAATMDGGSLMNSVTTGITNFGAVTQIVQKDGIQIANGGLWFLVKTKKNIIPNV